MTLKMYLNLNERQQENSLGVTAIAILQLGLDMMKWLELAEDTLDLRAFYQDM